MNVDEFLKDANAALSNDKAVEFVEKWIPLAVNEISELRNKVVLQETRILELEAEIE